MHARHRLRSRSTLLALLCLIWLPACGAEEAPPEVDGGTWSACRLIGGQGFSGVCALGSDLLLCAGGGDRSVYVVDRGALEAGAEAKVRKLEVTISKDVTVMGREMLARRGYTLGTLWNAGVDLQGIAVQAPDFVFLADASFRVVYWGKLGRDMAGALTRITIQHVFEVPGAQRTAQTSADYRDQGPGISGLFGVSGDQRTEDLYVVERARPGGDEETSQFRVLVLDRYGSLGGGRNSLGFFVLDVRPAPGPGQAPGKPVAPAVEGITWERNAKRFLCVRGAGRGTIHAFKNPGSMRSGYLGKSIPGPDLEGAGRWRGLTTASDGTWYLVSGAAPASLAWRTP